MKEYKVNYAMVDGSKKILKIVRIKATSPSEAVDLATRKAKSDPIYGRRNFVLTDVSEVKST